MTVRAVAVGIPDHLKEMLGALPGVVIEDDLVNAHDMLVREPQARVLYGEKLFGFAVTGQGPLLVQQQQTNALGVAPWSKRVMLVIDVDPRTLPDLEWDDPRKLAWEAGTALSAAHVVDLSFDGVFPALDLLLDQPFDTPERGVYDGDNGNDENGEPNV